MGVPELHVPKSWFLTEGNYLRPAPAFATVALLALFGFLSLHACAAETPAQQTGQSVQSAPPARAPRVVVRVPPEIEKRLAAVGFAAVPYSYARDSVAFMYRRWSTEHYPVVITSDMALHSAHLLFDWQLRFLEVGHLRGDLVNLTDALAAKMLEYHDDAADAVTKDAALADACYFIIAKRLLAGATSENAPEPWKGIIESELGLVADAASIAESPLFGYREDYTQYKPRGHYARSDDFATYFRAMMWYGRMKFRLMTADGKDDLPQARRAILICRALSSTKVKGETAFAVWKRIYDTTAFFSGRSDDLLPADCVALAAQTVQPPAVSDADAAGFVKAASQLRKPRILGAPAVSGVTAKAPDWRETTQGMSLFGQRYALDSDIMQRLTFDSVLSYEGDKSALPFTCVVANGMPIRAFPRGLDVMAVFGFKEAEEYLSAGRDDRYDKYPERLSQLKTEVAKARAAGLSDLYVMRLEAAAGLAEKPSGRLPKAYETKEWRAKTLTTALGSWTELRHDSALYTKMPYSTYQSAFAGESKAGPEPPQPPAPQGYVEPAPKLYAALRGCVEVLLDRITSLGYPADKALTGHLERFAGDLATLERIATKELSGEAVSTQDYTFIEGIGRAFSMPTSGYPHYRDVSERFMAEDDDLMPIVAEVHTDPNSMNVLEEAVGAPLVLYTVCPVEGNPSVCLGVAYSYYEFKWPATDRLTDETWRKMIDEGKEGSLPFWMDGYVEKQRP